MKNTLPKKYTDIDYDSSPVPDLGFDIHWTLLPIAKWSEKEKVCENRSAETILAIPLKRIGLPRPVCQAPTREVVSRKGAVHTLSSDQAPIRQYFIL